MISHGQLKKYAPPAVLAAAAALLLLQISRNEAQGGTVFFYADRGWALLYGIRDNMIAFSMPLLGWLMTFIDYEPARLLRAVNAAVLLLAFSAYNFGRLKGGRFAGALYALAAALAGFALRPAYDPEQVFFTLLIAVYLNMEAASGDKPGPLKSLLAGLALGGTLLVRSTLAFFPLVRVTMLAFSGRPRRALVKEAAALLIGSYILLLPWGRLNHSVSGGFSLFESERATSNLITGAKGSVFTMEGDARALAGISREENAFKWAAAQVAREPGMYLLAVAKRLWHVFKMFPVLFLLAGVSLVYLGRRADPLLTALAAYFVLIHCLMSIEERYFFPLAYLLLFVAAGGLAALAKTDGDRKGGFWTACALFAPVLGSMLTVTALVAAYPARVSGNRLAGIEAALVKRPGDAWLLLHKAEELRGSGRAEEGLEALRKAGRAADKYSDSDSGAILRIMESKFPETVPAVFSSEFSGPLFLGLRQLELGLQEEGASSLGEAYDRWNNGANMLRGTPYARDKEILAELRLKNKGFQDRLVYDALLYWPAERRAKIIGRLGKVFPLSDRLSLLELLSMPLGTAPEVKAFSALAGDGRIFETAGPEERRTAAEQLVRSFLPVKPLDGLGTVPWAVFSLLQDRQAGLLLSTAAFAAEPVGAEELSLLAALRAGAGTEAAEKLCGLRPGNPFYLYLNLKDSAERAALAAGALKKNPGLVLDAAAAYSLRGDARAGTLAAAALASGPLPPEQIRRAIFSLQASRRYKEALAAADTLAASLPGDWEALNTRGTLRIFLGDLKAAEADLAGALELNPQAWQAMLNLAALRQRQGRPGEAAGLYARALRCPGLPPGVKLSLAARPAAE